MPWHRTLAVDLRAAWLSAQRMLLLTLLTASGCASLTNPLADAIPVRHVPDELLAPSREDEATIPLTALGQPADAVYRLAPGDTLGIWIEGVLGAANQPPPLHVPAALVPRDQRRLQPAVGYPIPVAEDGTISLPLVDPLRAQGLSILELQKVIRNAYTQKTRILKEGNDRILVSLMQPRQIKVLVLRQENASFTSAIEGGVIPASKRGTGAVVELAANENDLLHALTLSGGLPGLDAYDRVVLFRNGFRTPSEANRLLESHQLGSKVACGDPNLMVSIPLRTKHGVPPPLGPEHVLLNDGDVVFVEARDADVFFTAGLLPAGEHVLPRDRSLDVLEAVARVRGPLLNGAFGTNNLAGNLLAPGIGNPSPSLLVVVRKTPVGDQVPIRVDLNRALVDRRERLVIQPGDLIVLQEHPREGLARYFSQNFFNFNLAWLAIRSSTATGVLDVGVPQSTPSRVGITRINP